MGGRERERERSELREEKGGEMWGEKRGKVREGRSIGAWCCCLNG